MSLRDDILGADDRPIEKLWIPEWRTDIYIRAMSAGERDRFEERHARNPYLDFRARLAVMCVCDEDGNLLFSETDIPAVTAKSGKALDRIFARCVHLNGISKDDIDEIKKNSVPVL